jgi:recombinational DNA repair ATPase RecF
MRLVTTQVTDFKRVRSVAIAPDADRALVLIGGRNAQGKSSVLDALTAAFGGKRALPADPVRHGAKEAVIELKLDGDDGGIAIKRVISPDGGSHLEVRDAMGAVRSPQALLDKLFGAARFLDPLAFLGLSPKEQRASLMKLIKDADRIDGLDEKRQRAFDKRTEVGRELTKAEGELARLAEVEIGVPIDVTALSAEQRAFADEQRAGDGLGNELRQAEKDAALAVDRHGMVLLEIQDLERKIAAAKARAAELETDREQALNRAGEIKERLDAVVAKWQAGAARRQQNDADLARADAHNRAVFAAEAQMKRRAEVAADAEQRRKEQADLTAVLRTIDDSKAAILEGAKLPVDGLSVADDHIVLNGVSFAQASRAEQLRVALALAMSASPGLDDVWIRDGALFDEDALAAIAEQAAAAGKRCWIERVSDRDPGVIVIQDGRVRDEEVARAG